MPDDAAFHFPPDVFNAVVDAVPLLTRSKRDVLLFFQGCGVDVRFLRSIEVRLASEPKLGKHQITKEVLTRLNSQGDAGLGARRQVIRRVSEYEEFSTCYPDNQLKAKGAVAAVAELVNKKDSFTRMRAALDEEQQRHREEKRAELQAAAARRETLRNVRQDLFALFGEKNPHRRGKSLEGVLNRLFQASDILVRESFVVVGEEGVGVVEQIDGAVELDGRLYLVEMKWWEKQLGRAEVASHLVSVYGRGEAGGIVISTSGYLDSAIVEYTTALSQRTVILVELREIVDLLTNEGSLLDLLRTKIREATMSKRPLVHPLDKA